MLLLEGHVTQPLIQGQGRRQILQRMLYLIQARPGTGALVQGVGVFRLNLQHPVAKAQRPALLTELKQVVDGLMKLGISSDG